MAEIIKDVPWGKKRQNAGATVQKKNQDRAQLPETRESTEPLAREEFDNFIRRKYSECNIYLATVKRQPASNETTNLRKQIAIEYIDEQLIRTVNNSEQNQWSTKPEFYHAVLDEIQGRKLLPKYRRMFRIR